MDYFSSDWHLRHRNILRFDKRDFPTIEDHDEYIIKKTMQTLKKGDNFYFLGDFCLGSIHAAEGFLQTLQSSGANLLFIKGNHDKDDMIRLYQKYGRYLGEQKKIRIPFNGSSIEVVLNHFAMRVWDKSHHGSLHFYAHSHDGLERESWGRSCDIGIMTALRIKGDYVLFTINELYEMLIKRDVKIIDHHGLQIRGYDPNRKRGGGILEEEV